MQQDVSSHADANGPAAPDLQVVEQRQRVERALAVGDGRFIVRRASVAVGSEQAVLTSEKFAAGIAPVGVAPSTAVTEKQRRALFAELVVDREAVQ